MIPKILHTRSQLFSYFNDFEDGAHVFGVSSDTYPKLFELAHREIVDLAPKGWKTNQKGNCKYLWFPPNALSEDDIEKIEDWGQRFKQYVLIGLNQHIEDHFSDELDFCMALDFNSDPKAGRRTVYGEAEYQLKYHDSRIHIKVLRDGLVEAISDLPIPAGAREGLLVSYVPAASGGCNVPRKLAKRIAAQMELELCKAVLSCPKSGLKGVSVEEKVPIWQELYDNGCVDLSEEVAGRAVIIVDDLYQSGATMWMFAKHLKSLGAKHVFGLPCVKSLRDSDNQ
jgi:predicted amidophosphoribosyltransferase